MSGTLLWSWAISFLIQISGLSEPPEKDNYKNFQQYNIIYFLFLYYFIFYGSFYNM